MGSLAALANFTGTKEERKGLASRYDLKWNGVLGNSPGRGLYADPCTIQRRGTTPYFLAAFAQSAYLVPVGLVRAKPGWVPKNIYSFNRKESVT